MRCIDVNEVSSGVEKNNPRWGKWRQSVESFLELATQKNDRMLHAFALRYAARYYYSLGDIPKAIQFTEQALLQFDGTCIQKNIAEMELMRYSQN